MHFHENTFDSALVFVMLLTQIFLDYALHAGSPGWTVFRPPAAAKALGLLLHTVVRWRRRLSVQ